MGKNTEVTQGRASKTVARTLRIIRMIEERPGITVNEIAEEIGISRQTVFNYLSTIESAGMEITATYDRGLRISKELEDRRGS